MLTHSTQGYSHLKKKVLLSVFVILSFFSEINAQLVVNNSLTPAQLVQNVLVGGGVTITNITYTGGAGSRGSFSNGAATNLGLNSGIVLCTGTVTQVANPASYFMNVNLGLAGDANLNSINNGCTTYDACILEFDFVPLSDTVKFRYVFGSEEYPNWVCSHFQDIFAFFVSGPDPAGGTYNNFNIALIPGTNLPVSVNSVNNGSVGSSVSTGSGGCISLAYSNLYVSNAPSGTSIAFDGFTVPLTAWCKVTPCETYHMKIAIADGYNGLYDSGVFLEANSFSSTSYTVSESYSVPSLGNHAVEGCSDGTFTFTLSEASTTPVTINYNLSGTATNGTDFATIPGSIVIPAGQTTGTVTVSPFNDGITEGTETVIISYIDNCNPQTDTLYIVDDSPISVNMASNVTTCPGGSATVSVNPSGGATPYDYSWSNSAGNVNSQTVSPATTTTYTVTVTDLCGSTATGNQTVTIATLTTDAGSNQTICSGSSAILTATNGGTYLWSNNSTTASITVSPTSTTTYHVTVTSSAACTATDSVTVNVVQTPVVNAGTDQNICSLNSSLNATSTAGTGNWTATGPGTITFGNVNNLSTTITASAYGNYTFIWTSDNGNGCTGSDQVVVNFLQNPVANAGTDDSTCTLNYTLQGTPSVGIGTWSQLSGPGTSTFVNQHLATTLVTVSADGSYVFQWVENNTACSDTDAVQILFYPQPVANTGSNGQICSLTYNLNAIPSVGTGNWALVSGPGTASFTNAGLATSSVTVSTQGTYYFSWTETNNICTSSDTVSVSFAVQPVANAGADTSECSLSYSLQAIASVGTGTWTFNGPGAATFSNSHNANSSVTVNASGTYQFVWTENNGLGCISSDTVQVNFSQPIANAGAGISVCQLSSSLGAIPSVGNGVWSQISGNGTVAFSDSTNPQAIATASAAGTYILQWTEVNGSNCSSSDTMIAVFTEMPTANAGVDTTICSQSYTFNAIPSIGTGTWTQISGTGISTFSDAHTSNSVVNVSAYGIYEFVWTEDNGNGCVDKDTINVTFNYIPTSDFQISTIGCFGDNATVTYQGNATNNASYNWNFGTADVVSGNGMGPYIINYNTTGTFTVSLQVTQSGCVSGMISHSVENPSDINVNVTANNVTCFGSDDGSVVAVVTGGVSPYAYHWSNGAPTSFLSNITEGTYILTVTDAHGCTKVISSTVNQPAKLFIDIGSNMNICPDSTLTIGSSATGGVYPYSYLWNNGLSTAFITISPQSTTTYSVTAMDANGCQSSSQMTVSVFPPVSLSAYSNINTICMGDMVTIYANAEDGNGNYTYSINNSIVSVPYDFYPAYEGLINYQVMVEDGCHSTATVNVPVTVHPLPPNNPSWDFMEGCAPLTVQFIEQSSGEELDYLWNFGDGQSAQTQNPLHVYSNPGTYSIALATTNSFGCQTYNPVNSSIVVYPVPTAQFISDPTIASIIKPMIEFTNYSSLANSVMWYFGDGDSSNLYNPAHQYASDTFGIYHITLVVISQNGCRDTAYGNIEITNELTFYAPTAFSPDDDGINDFFFVTGNGIDIKTFNIQIFDRWGEVIFESDDIYKSWDGKVKNGKIAPVGTYTWLVKFRDFNGVAHEKAGPVSIIR